MIDASVCIKGSEELGYESSPGPHVGGVPEETEPEKLSLSLYLNDGPVSLGYEGKHPGRAQTLPFVTPDEGLFDAIVEDEYGDTGPDQGHQILASTSTTCSSVVLRSESLAREKLRSKAFSFCDLFEVMSSLPLKPTKRHRCISGDPNVKIEHFLAGLYTHGSFTGVTRNTSAFPWVVKYVSAFGRTQVDESWSSRILSKNVKSSIHSDSRNLADTKVITMTFGAFTGGELWIEDGEGDNNSHPTYKEDAAKVRKGKLISTKEPPYGFDPKRKHCTEEWEGERWTLSFFTPRGFPSTSPTTRDELRDLRFPLRGLRFDERYEDFARAPRPKKSIRKDSWKTARRLASMTAWCTMAASSWASNEFPLGKKHGAATLFEVGDVKKTLEAGELDFVRMEPRLPEDLSGPGVLSDAKENVTMFEPETLWIHVDKMKETFNSLQKVLELQARSGRPIVLEFGEDTAASPQGYLETFLDKYGESCERREGERHLLRINGPPCRLGNEGSRGHLFHLKGEVISGPIQSSLKRLHQNLGHASPGDMARHLRLAGADQVSLTC